MSVGRDRAQGRRATLIFPRLASRFTISPLNCWDIEEKLNGRRGFTILLDWTDEYRGMGRYMEGGRETVTNRDLDTIVSNLKENKTNVRFSSRFVIFLTWIFRYFVVCVCVCVYTSYLYISSLSTFKIGVLRFSNRETCARDFL